MRTLLCLLILGLLSLTHCDLVTTYPFIPASNWYAAIDSIEFEKGYCEQVKSLCNTFNLALDSTGCDVTPSLIPIVETSAVNTINSFLQDILTTKSLLPEATDLWESVRDDILAAKAKAEGHVQYTLDVLTDPDACILSLARKFDLWQCRSWEKLLSDNAALAAEIGVSLCQLSDIVISASRNLGLIPDLLAPLDNLVTIPANAVAPLVRHQAMFHYLSSLRDTFANFRVNHPKYDEEDCHTEIIHKLTSLITRRASTIEEMDSIVQDLLDLNMDFSFDHYKGFCTALDPRFVELLVADITTLASKSEDGCYHFLHLWKVAFAVDDDIHKVVDHWFTIHKAIAISLFNYHDLEIQTNCTSCIVGDCTCYIDLVFTPRPKTPRVLTDTIEQAIRGCNCNEVAEDEYESDNFVDPAYHEFFQLDIDTDDFSPEALKQDDDLVISLEPLRNTIQQDYELESLFEDLHNDACDVLKKIADADVEDFMDNVADFSDAVLSLLDHSIGKEDLFGHQIRTRKLDVQLNQESIKVEIVKLTNTYRFLKKDWTEGNCNCHDSTCKYSLPYNFDEPSLITCPNRFNEGAVCQHICRVNFVIDVDIERCSQIEAMLDDVVEELLDHLRLKNTIASIADEVSELIDFSNDTGICKDLLDERTILVELRDDIENKVVRPVKDIIEDLSGPDGSLILQRLCNLIQHCNDDFQTNCSCVFDDVLKVIKCNHIIMGDDIDRPNVCHLLGLAAILGDCDETKYKEIEPTIEPTTEKGDQNPKPGCSSTAKRSVLADEEYSHVQTTYAINDGQTSNQDADDSGLPGSSATIAVSVTTVLISSLLLVVF